MPGARDAQYCWLCVVGTNFLVRANAILEVGGSPQYTLTEDFALGMEMKKFGWHCRWGPTADCSCCCEVGGRGGMLLMGALLHRAQAVGRVTSWCVPAPVWQGTQGVTPRIQDVGLVANHQTGCILMVAHLSPPASFKLNVPAGRGRTPLSRSCCSWLQVCAGVPGYWRGA